MVATDCKVKWKSPRGCLPATQSGVAPRCCHISHATLCDLNEHPRHMPWGTDQESWALGPDQGVARGAAVRGRGPCPGCFYRSPNLYTPGQRKLVCLGCPWIAALRVGGIGWLDTADVYEKGHPSPYVNVFIVVHPTLTLTVALRRDWSAAKEISNIWWGYWRTSPSEGNMKIRRLSIVQSNFNFTFIIT